MLILFHLRATGKERKETGEFIGAEGVRKHLKEGPPRRRVGLIVDGAPARREHFVVDVKCVLANPPPLLEGAKIFLPSGQESIGKQPLAFKLPCRTDVQSHHTTGVVTSGIPSPTLGKNIAMGYVQTGWHKKGTEIEVEVRNKLRKAVVTPMPFIKPKYWRG